MLDRRRSSWLDRLGRSLADSPASLRLGVAVAGLFLFIGLTSLAWIFFTTRFGARLVSMTEARAMNAIPETASPAAPGQSFSQRIDRVTEISKASFLDVGLSREHFITRLADPREFGSHVFDYLYWEVWVPEEFDIEKLLGVLREQKGMQAENARLEQETIDAKTKVIKVYLDGINTHQFLFTKAAQEAPEGARVLLANAPANTNKIDISAIPEVKYQGSPRLAIVIDDIGLRDAVDHLFFKLPAKVSLSVMPFTSSGKQTAELAHQRGHEILMHLPMEPLDMASHDPGQGKLLLAMNEQQIRQTVEADLAQVPYVAGVNNHMGSAFTRQGEKIQAALGPIKSQNLFFLDSMTIGDSAAYKTAKQIGVRSAARNIFLDISPDLDSIKRQVDLAGRIAKAQGQAIAIGHPFQNTYQALLEELPKLQAQGIEIVPVGQLAQ